MRLPEYIMVSFRLDEDSWHALFVVVWLFEVSDVERHAPCTTLNELDRTRNGAKRDCAAIWYPPGAVFTDGHV
jgi:hypothetical protein